MSLEAVVTGVYTLPRVVLKATQSSVPVHGAETSAGPTNKLSRVLKFCFSSLQKI